MRHINWLIAIALVAWPVAGLAAVGAQLVPGFDLVADTIAVLDALQIERVHYVGLSLGGMSGFGLGIHHADRLLRRSGWPSA